MAYEKKILVLKQTDTQFSREKSRLSGIIRIEIESGVAEFHLSLINLPKDATGEYYLLIVAGNGQPFYFYLGKTPSSASGVFIDLPDLTKGVAVGVYLVKDGIPLTLAFARADGFDFSLLDFKKTVAEKCFSERKKDNKKDERSPEKQTFICLDKTPQDTLNNESVCIKYDDEAVATLNYYELDEDIKDKLKEVKDKCDGNLQIQNELPFSNGKEETNKERPFFNEFENETDFGCSKEKTDGSYYLTIKDELNTVFATHDQELSLMKVFTDSNFVKIFYSKTKYYVVGLIKEDGKEKYICYGVPAVYSPEPPSALKGFCSFIPLSVFDMKGKGFWMMFQSASTGECLKIETV